MIRCIILILRKFSPGASSSWYTGGKRYRPPLHREVTVLTLTMSGLAVPAIEERFPGCSSHISATYPDFKTTCNDVLGSFTLVWHAAEVRKTQHVILEVWEIVAGSSFLLVDTSDELEMPRSDVLTFARGLARGRKDHAALNALDLMEPRLRAVHPCCRSQQHRAYPSREDTNA